MHPINLLLDVSLCLIQTDRHIQIPLVEYPVECEDAFQVGSNLLEMLLQCRLLLLFGAILILLYLTVNHGNRLINESRNLRDFRLELRVRFHDSLLNLDTAVRYCLLHSVQPCSIRLRRLHLILCIGQTFILLRYGCHQLHKLLFVPVDVFEELPFVWVLNHQTQFFSHVFFLLIIKFAGQPAR